MVKKSNWKQFVMIILLLVINCFIISCSDSNINESDIKINESVSSFTVNESFTLSPYVNRTNVYYESSDTSVVTINSYRGVGVSSGEAIIYAYNSSTKALVQSYLVSIVNNEPTEIAIEKTVSIPTIQTGNELELLVTITPTNANSDVVWTSSDETVASVSNSGVVKALKSGLVTIKCEAKNKADVCDTITLFVKGEATSDGTIINKVNEEVKNLDLSTLSGCFEGIIKKTNTSIVGINSYYNYRNTLQKYATGTGIIYKRVGVIDNGDGETEIDDSLRSLNTNYKYYKYYVITCKHLIESMTKVTVYFNNEEIEADVIAYDSKVDIGVISFTETDYFSTATFGDSSKVETGEFVLAIGNTYGADYYQSVSFGVISYNLRYLATDTDNDNQNDWDALYLQHDACIGSGSSGGPLINLKGEIIGINSVKISDEEVDNMAFAIPSNLVLELVEKLEVGIVPDRPLLKISVISVKDILKNDSLISQYNLPSDLKYGMYVAEVNDGGVGSIAGMKVGDIILEFNGIKLNYSYELRAALNEVIIGSNQEISILCLRNGEYVTLKAVF